MSRELVIAHYNENLDWVDDIQSLFPNLKITIYHKHSYSPSKNLNVTDIELPNVGREAHTYLYHIVNNYNQLSDYTMFVQGNPFDHMKKETLINIIKSEQEWVPTRYEEFMTKQNIDIFLCNKRSLNGDTLISWWNKYVNTNSKIIYKVVWNAQFMVHKKLIQHHSIEFYTSLLSTVNSDSNPLEAHFLERTWGNIFTDHINDPFEILYPEIKHQLV